MKFHHWAGIVALAILAMLAWTFRFDLIVLSAFSHR